VFFYTRLTFSVIIFLFALLVIIPAPTNLFWRLSIISTEFSHFLIITALILFFLRWFSPGLISDTLSILSIALFLFPIYQASLLSDKLPQELSASFKNDRMENKAPFSVSAIFFNSNHSDSSACYTCTYKKTTEKDLTFDFYPSVSGINSPCIIVVHGGSWASGDSKQLDPLNFYLAKKGYNVAAINYSLAPKNLFPAPLDDLKDAIAYLKDNASDLKIDTTKFVLLGRSAGGQIALLAAYTFNDASIKGVISFYAPADMEWAYSAPGNPLILDSRKVLREYIGGTYEEASYRFKLSSPLAFINFSCPPTLIIHGSKDEMVSPEHSFRLNRELENVRVKHYFLSLPWATHGCDFNFNGPSGQISTYAVEHFLNSVTK
jgi:acetyl esterase/lipase